MNLLHAESSGIVQDYLGQLRSQLQDLPDTDRDHLLSYARAQIELDLELEPAIRDEPETVRTVLGRLGAPEAYARRLRETLPKEEEPEEDGEAVIQERQLT